MKISPTAIRQKAFEIAFRGYEKKQVTVFLEEISVIMEQINQENLELRSRLQQVESEAKRLRDVEDSLFRTLKTAEDTGAAIITEATEAADQIIGEANQLAEESTKDAQRYAEELQVYSTEQARLITQAADEKAKETMKVLSENMSSLVKSYDALVEQREALVKSMRQLSQNALNQIDLSETHFSQIDAKGYQRAVDELGRANHFSVANLDSLAPLPEPVVAALPEEKPVVHLDLYSAEEEALLKGEALAPEAPSIEEEEEGLQGEPQVDEAIEDELEEELYEEEAEESLGEDLPAEEEEEYEEEYFEEEEEDLSDAHSEMSQPEVQAAPTSEHTDPASPEKPKGDESKPTSGSFFDQFD